MLQDHYLLKSIDLDHVEGEQVDGQAQQGPHRQRLQGEPAPEKRSRSTVGVVTCVLWFRN